jgi:hypothetical protein
MSKQKKTSKVPVQQASPKGLNQQALLSKLDRLDKEVKSLRKHTVVEYGRGAGGRCERSEGVIAFAELKATSTGFEAESWLVNPGDITLFPRLFQIARLYTKYRIRHIEVEFIPNSSSFGDAGKQGQLALIWSPTRQTGAPLSMEEAAQIRRRSPIVVPKDHCKLRLTSEDQDLVGIPWMDVYHTGHDTRPDPSKMFMGELSAVWEGVAWTSGSLTLGRLQMKYQIDFSGVQPSPSTVVAQPSLFAIGSRCTPIALTSGVFAAANLSSVSGGTTNLGSSIAPSIFSPYAYSGVDITLRPGTYFMMITVEVLCTAAAMTLISARIFDRNAGATFFTFDEGKANASVCTYSATAPITAKTNVSVGVDVSCTFSSGTTTADVHFTIYNVV